MKWSSVSQHIDSKWEGTLYEMLLRRRRVCKNTQRDIGQQPSLSAFPPTRACLTRARALAEPRLDKRQRAEVSAGSVETQRGAGKGRHNVRKSVGKMIQNEKCHFYGL